MAWLGRVAREVINIDFRKFSERPSRLSDIASPHDTLNRSIVAMLQQDGRMPFAEIAAALIAKGERKKPYTTSLCP